MYQWENSETIKCTKQRKKSDRSRGICWAATSKTEAPDVKSGVPDTDKSSLLKDTGALACDRERAQRQCQPSEVSGKVYSQSSDVFNQKSPLRLQP